MGKELVATFGSQRLTRLAGWVVVHMIALLLSQRAFADQASCEAVARRLEVSPAIVSVRALEHSATGFVFRDRSTVFVDAVTVEVSRPGAGIEVVDRAGGRHLAQVVARDEAGLSGLARLQVEPPIDAEPLEESHDPAGGCAVVLVRKDLEPWDLAGAGSASGVNHCSGELAKCWANCGQGHPCASPVNGSPILGSDGGVIATRNSRATPSRNVSVARLVALADDAPASFKRRARSTILYGAVASPIVEFSPEGGGWIGISGAAEARYHDMLAVRLAIGMLALPRRQPKCGEPPCVSGARLTIDPSVGFRLRLGGALPLSMAVTPSIGLAMRVQGVSAAPAATAFDATAPTFQAAAAPGLAFTVSIFELSARWKIAAGDVRQSTYQIAAGMVF